MADGVFVVDGTGAVTYVNEAIERFVDRDAGALVGASFDTIVRSGLVDADGAAKLAEALDALRGGDRTEDRLVVETADGTRVFEVRLTALGADDTGSKVVGVVREQTELHRSRAKLRKQQTVLYDLYEVSTQPNLSFDEQIERVLEIGCEFLELPYGFLTEIDGADHRMVQVVGDHEGLAAGMTTPLEQTYCKRTIESEDVVTIQDAVAELPSSDPARNPNLACYAGTKVHVGGELYGSFCFAAADARDREFTDSERGFIKLLGQWASHQLEVERFEARLRSLNDVGTELLLAETESAVARIAVDASDGLFDLPVTAYWSYDGAQEVLRPLAETAACREVVGEAPTFERGEALAWACFDAGDLRVYPDLASEAGVYDDETPLRSEVHVPVGDHGVIISGTTEQRGFDDTDVESLRLLGAIVETAMVSVDRRAEIAQRGEALQEQNARLEEFARVVAHDLRNPLAGAVGFLEIARETGSPDHFDRVAQSHDRMEALIDELLAIARNARTAVDPRPLSLDSLVGEAWSYLDAPASTLTVAGDLGTVEADETRLLQLLGNLFRNSVEHVGPGVTVEVGALEDGFYVTDDGPGLSEAARADVLAVGQTSSATGTGIGLASVTDIVDAHGWDLSIPADASGARFEIRTA